MAETGVSATLVRQARVTGATAVFSETGAVVAALYGRSLRVAPGAVVLVGQDAVEEDAHRLVGAAGLFIEAATATSMRRTAVLEAAPAAYSATGVEAVPRRSLTNQTSPRAFTLTGLDAVLAYSGASDSAPAPPVSVGGSSRYWPTPNAAPSPALFDYRCVCDGGQIEVVGSDAAFRRGYKAFRLHAITSRIQQDGGVARVQAHRSMRGSSRRVTLDASASTSTHEWPAVVAVSPSDDAVDDAWQSLQRRQADEHDLLVLLGVLEI